jgi:hypothetical protein
MKRHRVGKGRKAFNATIEFLGKGRALVSLTDQNGEWAGGHRIDVRSGSRDALYEAGYISASASAASHGGRLETFRAV